MTSQTSPVLKDEVSDGPDRSGVLPKEWFFKSIFSAVTLDDAVIGPWMQGARYGRIDFAEVYCISDSLLSGAVTSIGGRALPCNAELDSISPRRPALKN